MTSLHPELCTNHPSDVARMAKLWNALPTHHPTRPKMVLNISLRVALAKGHDRCVRFLLEAGADECLDLHTLNKTIESGNTKIMRALMEHGLTPDAKLVSVDLWLMMGLNQSIDIDMLRLLLEFGFPTQDYKYLKKPDGVKPYLNSAFEVDAAEIGWAQALKVLLMSGVPVDDRFIPFVPLADLTPEQKDALSLIHVFARSHRLEGDNTKGLQQTLHVLQQCGANLWQLDQFGRTPYESLRHFNTTPHCKRDIPVSEEVFEYLDELMKTPLSLKSWCRIALLRQPGRQYMRRLNRLAAKEPSEPTPKINTYNCEQEEKDLMYSSWTYNSAYSSVYKTVYTSTGIVEPLEDLSESCIAFLRGDDMTTRTLVVYSVYSDRWDRAKAAIQSYCSHICDELKRRAFSRNKKFQKEAMDRVKKARAARNKCKGKECVSETETLKKILEDLHILGREMLQKCAPTSALQY